MPRIETTLATTPVSVTLKDSAGKYGVRRSDTGVLAVVPGTEMTPIEVGSLTYEYSFDDLAYDLEYEYVICIEDPLSTFVYVPGLIEGAKLVESNLSWISRPDAELYFKERLWIEPWEEATDREKEKALVMGTQILQRLALSVFETVPQDLKNAICEIALSLLDGKQPDLEYENLNLTTSNYGGVRSTYDRTIPMEHLEAGVPSISAWRLIRPYLDVSRGIRLSRAS
jgi:hypothetical protein